MTYSAELLQLRSLKHLSSSLQGLIRGRLGLQVTIAMVLGLALGVLLGPSVGWLPAKAAAHISNW